MLVVISTMGKILIGYQEFVVQGATANYMVSQMTERVVKINKIFDDEG